MTFFAKSHDPQVGFSIEALLLIALPAVFLRVLQGFLGRVWGLRAWLRVQGLGFRACNVWVGDFGLKFGSKAIINHFGG